MGRGQGRQRLVGRATGGERASGSGSAPRSSSGVRDRCRGHSPTPRAARSAGDWSPDRPIGRLRRGAAGRRSRARPAAVSHVRVDPEIEDDGPHDPDGATPPRAPGRRLPAGAADPAECHADHRPARRRGGALGRSSQEVAPVREQGPHGRRRPSSMPTATGCGEFYRDLPRDGRPGGLPDPDRSGLPRRLGGVPAARPRPAAVRPDARRAAAGDAVPRAQRAAGRRAVRRHDPRRRRVAGELPPQVGGDPLVARAGRHELRPVGPRDRRHRPLQDRLRGPRGPLHRRVGPGPRSARAPGLRGPPSGRGSGGRGAATA